MGGTAQQSSLPQPPGQTIGSLPSTGGGGQFQPYSPYQPPPRVDPGMGLSMGGPTIVPDTPIYPSDMMSTCDAPGQQAMLAHQAMQQNPAATATHAPPPPHRAPAAPPS